MWGLVIRGLQHHRAVKTRSPLRAKIRVRLVQPDLDSAAARTRFGQKRGQRVVGIGPIGMQLQRLTRMQDNSEIGRNAMGGQPHHLGQKPHFGAHISAQKIDRNCGQGMAKVGGGNGS